jgi:hypothetical protein
MDFIRIMLFDLRNIRHHTDDVIVGDYVNATIQIKKYDNGIAKYKITGLE